MAKVKHVVNGDQANGWYCYQCLFSTRDVELAAAHDGVKIYTSCICPPIPMRQFDWSAWDDNLGADCSPVGHGRTEQEAINELTERLAESTERQMCKCPYAEDQSQEWHLPGVAGCAKGR